MCPGPTGPPSTVFGLAVYLVVLFHAGAGVVVGGFVGVDVFFVLSGFLVSTILLRELADTGRLAPPLLRPAGPAAAAGRALVVLATGCVAVVLLSTVRRAPLVGDAQSALLYVANWRFIAPVARLLLGGRGGRQPVPALLVAVDRGAVLLLLPAAAARPVPGREAASGDHRPGAARALGAVRGRPGGVGRGGPQPRLLRHRRPAYQLLAGALLAVAFRSARRPTFTRRAVGIGTLCPRPAWWRWPVPGCHVTPSVRGLLATVFAVGLVGSLAAQSASLPERFFSLPPLVFLGKISYGTYLWHWPVVILLREVVEPGVVARTILVVVLSTALATASYQMLERPVRSVKLRELFRGPTVMIALTASALIAVLAMPPVLERDGRPALALSGSGAAATGTARNATGPVPDVDFVVLRPGQGRHRAVLRPPTTSSPASWSPATPVPGAAGRRQPRPDAGADDDRPGPRARLQPERQHRDRVPVAARGDQAVQHRRPPGDLLGRAGRALRPRARGLRHRPGAARAAVAAARRPRDVELGRAPDDDRPVTSVKDLLVGTTDEMLADIEAAGVRSLVLNSIWHPPAEMGDPLECLATALAASRTAGWRCRRTGELQDSLYLAAAARSDDIFTVDINPVMCPSAPVCDAMLGKIPVWRDAVHYSPAILESREAQIWQAHRGLGRFRGAGPGHPIGATGWEPCARCSRPGTHVPTDAGWSHEVKWDGVRVLADDHPQRYDAAAAAATRTRSRWPGPSCNRARSATATCSSTAR